MNKTLQAMQGLFLLLCICCCYIIINMKRIYILLLALGILFLSSCNRDEEPNDIREEIIDKRTFIGTLFDVSHVKEEQNIIIDDNNKELVELSNREVFVDELSGNSYYIADINHPILVDKTPIYNDIPSLIKVISFLETEASYYLEDSNQEEINNEILAYIRTTNIEYDTEVWNTVCGESKKLREYLANQDTGGLNPNDYFAAFLDKSLFNKELYPLTKEEYIDKYLFLIDPIRNEAIIDLVHFVGVLDGTCINTGNTLDKFPYNQLEERFYQMVVSWAGDLQTAAEKIDKYELIDITFEEILKREELTFDLPDLIADMDGTNLGLNLDLSKISSLSKILEDYFEDIILNKDREEKFINSVAIQSAYSDGDEKEKFIKLTYEMLDLDQDGNEYKEGNVLGNIGKYYYLSDDEGNYCDISYRRHLADIFIHYFISEYKIKY